MNHACVTNKKGQLLVAALTFTAVASILVTSILRLATSEVVRSENLAKERLTDYLAEAGIEKAALELNKNGAYTGGTYSDLINGTYTVSVTTSGFDKIITSQGLLPTGSTAATAKTKSARVSKMTIVPGGTTIVSIPVQQAAVTDTGGVSLGNSSTIDGNVRTNGSITGQGNSQINGDAAASGTISSPDPTVIGEKTEGAPIEPLPGFDYDYWRVQANINNDPVAGFTLTNNETRTYGPKKINGDVTLRNNSILYLSGTVYITGNLTMDNSSQLQLDSNLINDNKSAVLIIDGEVNLNNSAKIEGGTDSQFVIIGVAKVGGYGFIHSGSTSGTNNSPVVYALHSTVQFAGTSSGYTIIAKGLEVKNSATIGIKSPVLVETDDDDPPQIIGTVSSPGVYTFVKGSYQEVK